MRAILKWFLILAAALVLPAAAFGQTTTVTGTIVDPNGVPYGGATVTAQLTNPGATVTNNSQQQCVSAGLGSAPCQMPIPGTVGPAPLDPTGSFTLNLYSNTSIQPGGTQWVFTVGIAPGVVPPWGTGPQSFSTPITITGGSQSVSSTLNAIAPKLTQPFTPGGGITGTIAFPEVAFGTAANVIGGDPNFTFDPANAGFSLTTVASTAGISLTNSGNPGGPGSGQSGILLFDSAGSGIGLESEGGGVSGNPGINIDNTDNGPMPTADQGTRIQDDGAGMLIRVTGTHIAAAPLQIFNTGTGIIDLETDAGVIQLNLVNGFAVKAGPLVTSGVDNTSAGIFRSANGAAAAHTDWGSQATTSNEVDGPATPIVTGDLVSMTTVGAVQKMTDTGISQTGVVKSVTASPPLTSSGGQNPNIACPTCSTSSATKGIVTSAYTNATTGQTAITGLSIPVAANTNYALHCALIWQQSALGSLIVSSTGPAAPTHVTAESVGAPNPGAGSPFLQATDGTTFGFTLTVGIAGTTATDLYSTVELGVLNGANAGTFQLTAASTTGATLTIQPGSYCTAQ